MADVFLTLNGIGQGHLVRALRICEWMQRRGRNPLIFHQGKYPAEAARRFPGVSIPALYQLPRELAQAIADNIASSALQSEPAIIVEDTHPAEVQFPPEICRILIVRPTKLDHMRMLRRDYSALFRRMIVCDHPESPTWPYSESETREILGWEGWQIAGPLYRRWTSDGIERVRARYSIAAEDRVIVLSLGGGGEKPGTDDRNRFLQRAAQVVAPLRRQAHPPRILLICGPLFPEGAPVPEGFEVIASDPDLPSLFAVADAAVIRAGYNSVWECLSAGTPFIAFCGTTYREPTEERIESLRRIGLLVPEAFPPPAEFAAWRESFRGIAERYAARFDGSPESEVVAGITGAAV